MVVLFPPCNMYFTVLLLGRRGSHLLCGAGRGPEVEEGRKCSCSEDRQTHKSEKQIKGPDQAESLQYEGQQLEGVAERKRNE